MGAKNCFGYLYIYGRFNIQFLCRDGTLQPDEVTVQLCESNGLYNEYYKWGYYTPQTSLLRFNNYSRPNAFKSYYTRVLVKHRCPENGDEPLETPRCNIVRPSDDCLVYRTLQPDEVTVQLCESNIFYNDYYNWGYYTPQTSLLRFYNYSRTNMFKRYYTRVLVKHTCPKDGGQSLSTPRCSIVRPSDDCLSCSDPSQPICNLEANFSIPNKYDDCD
uniref:CUB domain-containing protein n=1 Tax=Parastrongyloides trichosuri TaxID=131310 RepID=A0A0N5A6B8_PARTI